MLQYSYTLTNNKVVRSVKTVYPELADIKLAMGNGTLPMDILSLAKTAYQGVAEEPTIAIEEAWWSHQHILQELEAALASIPVLTATTKLDATGATVPLTQLELTANQVKLDNLRIANGAPDVASLKTILTTRISYETTKRDEVENGTTLLPANPWLAGYRGVTTAPARPVNVGVVPPELVKELIAMERDRTVRNMEDTLADLSKMNSLLFSMVSAMYSGMPTTQKNKIPAAEKAIIDYAVSTFTTVQTRGNDQLQAEGTALIDKLYRRESAIAKIVATMQK